MVYLYGTALLPNQVIEVHNVKSQDIVQSFSVAATWLTASRLYKSQLIAGYGYRSQTVRSTPAESQL